VRRLEGALAVRPGDHGGPDSGANRGVSGRRAAETSVPRSADGFRHGPGCEGESTREPVSPVGSSGGPCRGLAAGGRAGREGGRGLGDSAVAGPRRCQLGWHAYYQGDYARALVMQKKPKRWRSPIPGPISSPPSCPGLGARSGRRAGSVILEQYRRQSGPLERAADSLRRSKIRARTPRSTNDGALPAAARAPEALIETGGNGPGPSATRGS